MCGIVGYLGEKPVLPILLEGLKRLEYRGYDSTGVAFIEDKALKIIKTIGKIEVLQEKLRHINPINTVAIGHTRWATHGEPSEKNSHPIYTDTVAVVHNGIIDNYLLLKNQLEEQGVVFITDTDTEVIVHLLTMHMRHENINSAVDVIQLIEKVKKQLSGMYAFVAIFPAYPDNIYIVKNGAPIAIGIGHGEMFVSSDAYAVAPFTEQIVYLEDHETAMLTKDNYMIFSYGIEKKNHSIKHIQIASNTGGKENYQHFMQKEIFEQPVSLSECLNRYVQGDKIFFPEKLSDVLDDIANISIIACGSAYYAGVTAKYWLEEYTRISTEVVIASEFKYSNPIIKAKTLYIFISQSGETLDTISAAKLVKSQNGFCVAVLNVVESSLANIVDVVLPIYAGQEIGVASTKAFTGQLMVLAILSIYLAQLKQKFTEEDVRLYLALLNQVPEKISRELKKEEGIKELAYVILPYAHVLFISRGINYASILEGALKLKELTYIHAEAIAAGELKHGSIALIDENILTVALAAEGELFEKILSNINEIIARKGPLLVISSKDKQSVIHKFSENCFFIDSCHHFISSFIYAIPFQLLSYHTALLKGTDIDQPRNLAKSVTVE